MKQATARTRKPARAAVIVKGPDAPKKKALRENLCVVAFRLTAGERDAIHRAAGPARAA